MTAQEFSNEFDVLYNSITNGNAPGVTEYEKSVFLTRAQLEFIQELIKGNTVYSQGVDDTTNVRLQLYPLYKTAQYTAFKKDLESKKVLHILNVEFTINGKTVPTVPISYDEYTKIKNNPFKSNKNRAYYIQNSSDIKIYYDGSEVQLEFNEKGGAAPVETKLCWFYYIEYPTPIVTDSALKANTIDDNTGGEQNCILPKSTHFEILKKAVQLALIANGAQS